jgi:hypothetical protein
MLSPLTSGAKPIAHSKTSVPHTRFSGRESSGSGTDSPKTNSPSDSLVLSTSSNESAKKKSSIFSGLLGRSNTKSTKPKSLSKEERAAIERQKLERIKAKEKEKALKQAALNEKRRAEAAADSFLEVAPNPLHKNEKKIAELETRVQNLRKENEKLKKRLSDAGLEY